MDGETIITGRRKKSRMNRPSALLSTSVPVENLIKRPSWPRGVFVVLVTLSCLAPPWQAKAIDTTDTRYGNFALSAVTTGTSDTAIGYDALRFTTSGNYNTSVGANALSSNQTGVLDTAIGSGALQEHTTAT